MTDPTQNSRNPANSGILTGAFREILGKFLAGVDDMLPAVVLEYDREENRATVRPLIRLLKTDGTLLDRAQVASVPVLNLGGGGFVLSFNILPGDLGWIKASDRDISLFLQSPATKDPEESAEDVGPNTLRKHNFSDSIFIPDQFKKWTIQSGDESAVVLQSLDGTERIAIDGDGVRINSESLITLTAPTIEINGDIAHTGDQTTSGTITGDIDVVAGTISSKTHKHDAGTYTDSLSGTVTGDSAVPT